jgi:hypothetical protein
MLGPFSRRPRPDAKAVLRLKHRVTDLMPLGDKDHIAVAELDCHEPGCPDLETVATVSLADRRRFVRHFPCALCEVTEDQVRSLRADLHAR